MGSGLCNLSQGPGSSVAQYPHMNLNGSGAQIVCIYIMPGFLSIPGDCLPLVTQLAGGQLLGSGSTIVATSFTADQHCRCTAVKLAWAWKRSDVFID